MEESSIKWTTGLHIWFMFLGVVVLLATGSGHMPPIWHTLGVAAKIFMVLNPFTWGLMWTMGAMTWIVLCCSYLVFIKWWFVPLFKALE